MIVCIIVLYALSQIAAKITDEDSRINQGNPFLERSKPGGVYERLIKPILDTALSFAGLVLLAPLFLAIGIAVYADDPGPIFFTQKRMGKNKRYFLCHKYRTMKTSAPHNVPTHLLENPEWYITRVGKFLRKYSLDELPQLWDAYRRKLSLIGPRPALWNQDDLIAERDKYGANDIMPGITGWAQINGRDELAIDVKARYDGEYAKAIQKGGIPAFIMDIRCFFGTFFAVFRHKGVVEGRTKESDTARKERAMQHEQDTCPNRRDREKVGRDSG